jgi:hypothetical protein
MIYVAFVVVLTRRAAFDVVICDQVSACIPVFKWLSTLPVRQRHCRERTPGKWRSCVCPKVLFYCHYPDLLLTTRQSSLKRLYRAPLDWVEEKTTGMADTILVNSKFTAGQFRKTFTSIHRDPGILYPCVDARGFGNPRRLDPGLLPTECVARAHTYTPSHTHHHTITHTHMHALVGPVMVLICTADARACS